MKRRAQTIEDLVAHLRSSDGQVQRLIAQADGYARRVTELEQQLARTQEWLERFQGTAAAADLDAAEARQGHRTMRALLVEADSYLGLVVHRHRNGPIPDDLVEDMDGLRRRMHPHVAARGRVEMVHEAASKAVDSGPAGSTPAAPTGAVEVDDG